MHAPKPSRCGFSLFVSTLALIVAFGALLAVALKLEHGGQATAQDRVTTASEPTAAAPQTVSLSIKSDEEHAKKGPEGTWHDAYLPAAFTVQPGTTVDVVVHNYDESQHSFTAPGLGVDQMISAGSSSAPSTTTFTFRAPTRPGHYEWHCMMPCDPWSMSHIGFMRGIVTVA